MSIECQLCQTPTLRHVRHGGHARHFDTRHSDTLRHDPRVSSVQPPSDTDQTQARHLRHRRHQCQSTPLRHYSDTTPTPPTPPTLRHIRAQLVALVRVTTGAAPCTLAQSDVEASRCGCFAHAMHSVQGAARCANHRDAPRCRCTQVVMHRGARCTSVHGDARRAKMRCLSQYLTSLVFLVLLQCCPRVKETFNRAGMHLGAGAHSVQ